MSHPKEAAKLIEGAAAPPPHTSISSQVHPAPRQKRLGAKAFDVDDQLVRVDLYSKGEQS
jgi:hypothetical protein